MTEHLPLWGPRPCRVAALDIDRLYRVYAERGYLAQWGKPNVDPADWPSYRVDCDFADDCIDLAIGAGWAGFGCHGCPLKPRDAKVLKPTPIVKMQRMLPLAA